MKIIAIILLLNLLGYFCLIKLSDRIAEKQPEIVSKTMIRIDSIMADYYGMPVDFERLNKMSPKELDTIIKKAGY